MEKYMLLYCAACAVFTLFFWGFVKRTKKEGTQYNENSVLTKREKKAIALSAIYSAQLDAYVDSLNTGLQEDYIKQILEGSWGIYNESDAISTLDYLNQKGFQFYFPKVLTAFSNNQEDPRESLNNQFESSDDYQKAVSQTIHLQETYTELVEDEIISGSEDLNVLGVAGWDYGRLVFIARLCYDFGLIREDQAWEYIEEAHSKALDDFRSWEDFGKSYVLGRALWGGPDTGNREIAEIAKRLYTSKKGGPWQGSILG